MNFVSIKFIVFFIFVLLIKLVVQDKFDNKINNLILLVFNYVFYIFFDYRFLILLIGLTLVTYFCALNIRKRYLYITGIVVPIIVLCFFKYFNFFLDSFNIETFNIVLPVGISFYTFEAISYIVDVNRGKINAEVNIINFATYLSFFPNIVSGPIARASNLLVQIKENRKVEIGNILIGIQVMTIGYFKKIVIADRLAVFTNEVFSAGVAYNWLTVLLAIFSYSIQIYMDFSGYSDIAIGVSKCLGYNFDKNFDLPYASSSVTEFWRRWHISLSSWFKDYVYIPLGGNRKGEYRQLFNLIIVMSLSGLWHGANYNFALWGFVNGVLLCLEKKLFRKHNSNFLNKIITFVVISMTWVFFNTSSLNEAFVIFKAIFTLQDGVMHLYIWSFVYFIVTIVYVLVIRKKDNKYMDYYLIQDLSTIKGLTIFISFLGLILCLAYANTNPFIYFRF